MVNERKKTRKNGLTGSRKKRVLPSRKPDLLDRLDALNQCCYNLAALGGLMQACGEHPWDEPLNREMIGDTGSLILREVRQVQALLDGLGKAAR
jgi:hypothetical protein